MKSKSTEASSFSGYELADSSGSNGKAKPRSLGSDGSTGKIDVIRVVLFFTTMVLSCLLVYKSVDKPLQVMLPQWKSNSYSQNQTSLKQMPSQTKPVSELERVLMNAAMEDKTVIITTLNYAWAAPDSLFDLFLESFRTGLGTKRLLKHVLAVCFDSKAYDRCLQVHSHCYLLNATDSDGLSGRIGFYSPGYLKLMWRKMGFLVQVLTLGYNFLFTDADVLWFRDPFPRFYPNIDFQMSCDDFNGKPSDKNNRINSGFIYVKANNRTIKFYKYWCDSGKRFNEQQHDQDAFNSIKNGQFFAKLDMSMRFLDTVYFGGFCEPSKDINVVNTMHANCCIGLDNKIKHLKAALEDWKRYLLMNTTVAETRWNVPRKCGY